MLLSYKHVHLQAQQRLQVEGCVVDISALLQEIDKHWVDELDSVLCGLRTTPNRSTGYTPFFMVYGAEAVLPCDIIHDSP